MIYFTIADGLWIKGMTDTIRRVHKIADGTANKQLLLGRMGNAMLDWIDHNFEVEGAERRWKKLSPHTLFANKALGRGTKVLEGMGKLRRSFRVKFSPISLVVGSPLAEALYAQYGTRLHYSTAKTAGSLAFPAQWGRKPSEKTIKKEWKKGGRNARKALAFQKAGGSKKAFGDMTYGFYKRVRNDPIEPRRVLPSPSMIRRIVQIEVVKFMKDIQLD